jgi:hypothetical protein
MVFFVRHTDFGCHFPKLIGNPYLFHTVIIGFLCSLMVECAFFHSFKVQVLALSALERQLVSYFSPGKATGEINRCWQDKIAALPTFLLHLELHLPSYKKLQVEINNMKYQHWRLPKRKKEYC